MNGAFFYVVLLCLWGAMCGYIWQNKGGSFIAGFLLGFFLFLIGLIIVLAARPHEAPAVYVNATAAPTRPAPGLASTPPNRLRECPHCKEPMRRDASVCPHCQRESEAWEFRDGRWWTSDEAGERWYSEASGDWREPSEIETILTCSSCMAAHKGATKGDNCRRCGKPL